MRVLDVADEIADAVQDRASAPRSTDRTSRTSMSNAIRMKAIAGPAGVSASPAVSTTRGRAGLGGIELGAKISGRGLRCEPRDPGARPCSPRLVVGRFSPRPVVGLPLLHLRADEQQCVGALRERRGEEHATWGHPRESQAGRRAPTRRRRSPRARRPSFLERPDLDAVREPHAALVELDHAGEGCESLDETAVARALPRSRRDA